MTEWPKQSEAAKFYGRPGTNQTSLPLSYPMRLAWDRLVVVHKITINKRCADSAHRAFERITKEYSVGDRQSLGLDLFGGCYNNRKMRGGSQPSMHAYACAIDFDPERNQLKWGRDQARLAQADCEAFWRAWEEEGWVSLGRARNFDWMHVQAARL